MGAYSRSYLPTIATSQHTISSISLCPILSRSDNDFFSLPFPFSDPCCVDGNLKRKVVAKQERASSAGLPYLPDTLGAALRSMCRKHWRGTHAT